MNELWSPLLEKAYAKLKGNYYGALTDGITLESLVDLTGGIGYFINLQMYRDKEKLKKTLFGMMDKSHKAGSLMACSKGIHTMGVTKVVELSPPALKQITRLIRIRDPHGYRTKEEWTGAWCDGCSEWNQLSPAELEKLEYIDKKDGEFWMTYEDFMKNYDSINFAFSSPNDVSDQLNSDKWQTSEVKGRWTKNITAGGSLDLSPETYHMNPQYKITLDKPDAGDDCNLIVSLMQDCDRRKKDGCTTSLKFIGFKIYKISESVNDPLDTEFLEDEDNIMISNYHPFGMEKKYWHLREQTGWFTLEPGTYMIIPSINLQNIEGTFLLRIFVDVNYKFKAVNCKGEGCKVAPPKPVHDEL